MKSELFGSGKAKNEGWWKAFSNINFNPFIKKFKDLIIIKLKSFFFACLNHINSSTINDRRIYPKRISQK